MLVLAVALVFGAVAAIMLRVLPGPRSDSDYLVAGAIATFAAMFALFLVLINNWIPRPDVFYKKRSKQAPPSEAPPPPPDAAA